MLMDKLKELKIAFVDYANLVEDMLEKSVAGLTDKDARFLNTVINELEPESNRREVELEEKSIITTALFQPEARGLRTVIMIIKMNNDLERIADMCVNISESGVHIIEKECYFDDFHEIVLKMFAVAVEMYKDSIKSFLDQNSQLAKETIERDDEVDNDNRELIKKCIEELKKETDCSKIILDYLRIGKNIERIADLATNICEDVIFMVEGIDIRHKN